MSCQNMKRWSIPAYQGQLAQKHHMNSVQCNYFYPAGVVESGNPLDCPPDIFHRVAKLCRPLEEVRMRTVLIMRCWICFDLKVRGEKWWGGEGKGADPREVRKIFKIQSSAIPSPIPSLRHPHYLSMNHHGCPFDKVQSTWPIDLPWDLCSRCLLSPCPPLVLQVLLYDLWGHPNHF